MEAYYFGYFLGICLSLGAIVAQILVLIDGCKSKQKSTKIAAWYVVIYVILIILLAMLGGAK